MSKKDYILIAAAFARAGHKVNSVDKSIGVSIAAMELADALAVDNPRFDKARFLSACEVR